MFNILITFYFNSAFIFQNKSLIRAAVFSMCFYFVGGGSYEITQNNFYFKARGNLSECGENMEPKQEDELVGFQNRGLN